MGFATSKSDSSLFIQQSQNGPVSLLLYVDDLVIAGTNPEEIGRVKSQLVASFNMKDLGDLHYFLDRSDPNTPRHIDQPMSLCIEYVFQVRHDRLLTGLNTPGLEFEATSRLQTSLQWEMVPKNFQKPHMPNYDLGQHQISDRSD